LGARQILILTGDAGLGHRSAAEAIATALEERHAKDCAVQIVNPLNDERVPAALCCIPSCGTLCVVLSPR
jgi:hypothetical protein